MPQPGTWLITELGKNEQNFFDNTHIYKILFVVLEEDKVRLCSILWQIVLDLDFRLVYGQIVLDLDFRLVYGLG